MFALRGLFSISETETFENKEKRGEIRFLKIAIWKQDQNVCLCFGNMMKTYFFYLNN